MHWYHRIVITLSFKLVGLLHTCVYPSRATIPLRSYIGQVFYSHCLFFQLQETKARCALPVRAGGSSGPLERPAGTGSAHQT